MGVGCENVEVVWVGWCWMVLGGAGWCWVLLGGAVQTSTPHPPTPSYRIVTVLYRILYRIFKIPGPKSLPICGGTSGSMRGKGMWQVVHFPLVSSFVHGGRCYCFLGMLVPGRQAGGGK